MSDQNYSLEDFYFALMKIGRRSGCLDFSPFEGENWNDIRQYAKNGQIEGLNVGFEITRFSRVDLLIYVERVFKSKGVSIPELKSKMLEAFKNAAQKKAKAKIKPKKAPPKKATIAFSNSSAEEGEEGGKISKAMVDAAIRDFEEKNDRNPSTLSGEIHYKPFNSKSFQINGQSFTWSDLAKEMLEGNVVGIGKGIKLNAYAKLLRFPVLRLG